MYKTSEGEKAILHQVTSSHGTIQVRKDWKGQNGDMIKLNPNKYGQIKFIFLNMYYS